eukprot:1881568-Prymnesium_polylepis.1
MRHPPRDRGKAGGRCARRAARRPRRAARDWARVCGPAPLPGGASRRAVCRLGLGGCAAVLLSGAWARYSQ